MTDREQEQVREAEKALANAPSAHDLRYYTGDEVIVDRKDIRIVLDELERRTQLAADAGRAAKRRQDALEAAQAKIGRLRDDAETVTRLLELGDTRLMASDGPIGGQIGDLHPDEWAEVYQACKRISAALEATDSEHRIPRHLDIIYEAINEYDAYMLDDRYDAQHVLNKIIARMKEKPLHEI